jgi:hypothetical protein
MSSSRFCSLLAFLLALNAAAIARTLPHMASLSGSMLFQAFSVRPSGTIDLGPSAVGVNTPHAFPVPIFVQNVGAADLNIAPSFSNNDFGFTAESTFNTPVILAPGQTKEGDILFQPTAAGVRTGQFISTDNAPGSPHMVPLTGVGVTVPGNDFGIVADANITSVPSGKTTTFKIWLLAGPGLPNGPDGTLQCSGGPSGTSCNLAGNAFSIDASSGFGSTRQSVPVTVSIPARSASLHGRPFAFWWSLPAVLALALLRPHKRNASLALAIMSIALLSGLMVSCGGGSNSNSGALLFTASRNGTTHTLSLPVQ